MNEHTEALRAALARLRSKHLEEFRRLVEVPSVSTEGRGIDEAAKTVAGLLAERGFSTEIRPTAGNPVVCAWGGNADGPTLLFYEHYDVQPVEPLEEWTTEPFAITERDGKYFGRGTADTKGHIMCRIAAIDAVREVFGKDPIRYVFMIEGEEEVGSPNLESFIHTHARDFGADGCLWEFGGVDEEGRPSVTLGLKGIASVELRAQVPSRDVHSSFGAVIDNPLYRLAAAIASLRDDEGRVTIDGFYDDVRPLTEREIQAIEDESRRGNNLKAEYGLDRFLGDASGFELNRRLNAEPCVNVNGIHGGWGGPGTKTVLPSKGIAKLDFRLVPDQDPVKIVDALRAHLSNRGFADIEVVMLAGEGPGRTSLDDPFVEIVKQAARDAYEMEPTIHVSSAGTGPAAPFADVLRVPFATLGCAYPGSRGHAPDENIRIPDFENAKLSTALVIAGMAR